LGKIIDIHKDLPKSSASRIAAVAAAVFHLSYTIIAKPKGKFLSSKNIMVKTNFSEENSSFLNAIFFGCRKQLGLKVKTRSKS